MSGDLCTCGSANGCMVHNKPAPKPEKELARGAIAARPTELGHFVDVHIWPEYGLIGSRFADESLKAGRVTRLSPREARTYAAKIVAAADEAEAE